MTAFANFGILPCSFWIVKVHTVDMIKFFVEREGEYFILSSTIL